MGRTAKPWFYRQTGWWMVWLNGKKVKLAKGRKNKKAAEERLLELRFEISANPTPAEADQTVASVIDAYLEYAGKRLAESTLQVRTPYLHSLAELHGWRRIADCRPHLMETWIDEHPEWRSDWTKASAIANVQVAFNWAARTCLIPANPFRGVTHRPGSPRRDMTPDEFFKLLRATRAPSHKNPSPDARFREVFVFLWLTGCRPKEACILQWKHVDFENAVIVLPIHKTINMQRKPTPRIVPLHPRALKILRAIRRREEGAQVFLTHCMTPWTKNSLGQRVRRARQKAGIAEDAKLYGVRHAFGARGIVNGCDIKTLSTLMGHTTTRMTEHYVHLAGQREHLASAMRIVNARRRDA